MSPEPDELDKIQKKANKLKRIRIKQKHDEEIKSQFGIPTSIELEQQFYHGNRDKRQKN